MNNSEILPINQYYGMGFTGFGMSWAWLNPNIFDRSSELMFQYYYQAHLVGGTFFQPAISYIPTPGAMPDSCNSQAAGCFFVPTGGYIEFSDWPQ